MTNKNGKSKGASRVRVANSNRRIRRMRSVYRPRVDGILAGYGSAITSSITTRMVNDGCVVRGMDLVDGNLASPSSISYFITANPVTWGGTRVAGIASVFQNYRPRKFVIHYRPQTGSTSAIAVFVGTMWQNNYITSASSIEPGLLTSPGGTYSPAWQSFDSEITLGTNLPQRMFPIRDPDMSTVPFSVVARAVDTGTVVALPGRIFIEYEYEFRNAIGGGSSGFGPGQFSSVTVTSTGINQAGTEGPNGWIVDMAPNQISTTVPLFAHVTWDRSESGTASVYYLEINGTGVVPGAQIDFVVYREGGNPS